MQDHFDIIVIGSGPAGAAAAITAKRLGHSVALLDKSTFPRHKLCGAMLSGRAMRALRRIFDLETPDPDALVSRKIRFRWQGEEIARFDAPHPLTLSMRFAFDARLHRAAVASGAQDFCGHRIEQLDLKTRRVRLQDRDLNYRILIGADGVNSLVARSLFGRAFNPAEIGFGLEAEFPPEALTGPKEVQIDFRAVNWGYGWVFPKANSWTIGIGGLLSRNPDMKAKMARYCETIGVNPADVPIKGHHLPFGEVTKGSGRRNVLLAGDAAGLVDPLTGEGIAYALESGAHAAEAASEALGKSRPHSAHPAYKALLQQDIAELKRARLLRRLAFLPALEPHFRDRLTHSERLRHAFFDLLDGQESYHSLQRQARSKTLKAITTGLLRS